MAGRISKLAYGVYEVELEIGKDGTVLAVVEQWRDRVGRVVKQRRRRLKRIFWLL